MGEGGGGGSPAFASRRARGALPPRAPPPPESVSGGGAAASPSVPAPVERAARTIAELTGAGPVAAREAAEYVAAQAVAASLIEDQPGWLDRLGKFADRPDRMAALVNADARRRHPCLRRITSDVLNDATDPTVGSPFGDLMDYIEENPEAYWPMMKEAASRLLRRYPRPGRMAFERSRVESIDAPLDLPLPFARTDPAGKCGGSGPPPPASPTIELTSFAVAAATSKCPPLEPPVLLEDPVRAARGWVENTVEPWLREGTYVCESSRVTYRGWLLGVPDKLAALGFKPPPTAPTSFERSHIEALKYRATSCRGASKGRRLASKSISPLLSKLRDLLGYWGRVYKDARLLALVSDARLWHVKEPRPVRPAKSLETTEDLERLIAVCADLPTQVGVVLGAYSGLRIGDILGLEVRDLELYLDRPSWVLIRSGKGDVPRHPPVPPVARNVLLSAVQGLSPKDKVYGRTAQRFRDDLATAGLLAHLGHVYPHRLRSTFIVFSLRAGVPETVLMEWVAHKDPKTTAGYKGHDSQIETRARGLYEAYLASGSA